MNNKYSIIIGNCDVFYRTAGYKAPHDVRITLDELGFKSVFFDGSSGIKLVSLLQIMLRIIKFSFVCVRETSFSSNIRHIRCCSLSCRFLCVAVTGLS